MSFSTLLPDSRTLVSKWKQNLLSSEKRILDHCATVQFFFSLAQVRRLWRQLYPNSLTRLCVVALDALTPASVHSLWSSPKFLNRVCLKILIMLRFSRLVVHLCLPHFFLPLNFLLTCLDTCKRSPYQVLSTYTVNEHTFQKANNSLKHFCIGLMKYSNLLR